MKKSENPLLFDEIDPAVDLQSGSPIVHARKRKHKREIRDLRRQQTAAEAISGWNREIEIHGFTKGQFSIIDLIRAVLRYTGPARLDISTWTAATTDVTSVLGFIAEGLITDSRWLVDLTFSRRSPELAHKIREAFGDNSIRVAQNHAKLYLVGNGEWKVVVETSMNLNFNPRFEHFTLKHDRDLYDFYAGVFDGIWKKQPKTATAERPYEIEKAFRSGEWE